MALILQALPIASSKNPNGEGVFTTLFLDFLIAGFDIVAIFVCVIVTPWRKYLPGLAGGYGIFILLFIPACIGIASLGQAMGTLNTPTPHP